MGLIAGPPPARLGLPNDGEIDLIRRSRAFAVTNVDPAYKYIDIAHLFDVSHIPWP
jgi:hypothetical protein